MNKNNKSVRRQINAKFLESRVHHLSIRQSRI